MDVNVAKAEKIS